MNELRRRAFLGACASAPFALATPAAALSRTPVGGVLRLSAPLPTATFDLDAIDEPLVSWFGAACAEPLFALDDNGRPYATLAAGLPQQEGSGCRVRLRPGLKSGRGRPLDATDVLASLRRARRGAGRAWLQELAKARATEDPLAIAFDRGRPERVAELLAHPFVPLLASRSNAHAPDGTGPFIAEPSARRLVLRRNPHAARGPAFLERIELTTALDLPSALRAFELGDVDVALATGVLHRARADAEGFALGPAAWVLLRTGAQGAFGAPGVAQRLADTVGARRLEHLGVHAVAGQPDSGPLKWNDKPSELLVRRDLPQLVAVARVVAATLSSPGHELTVVELDAPAFGPRRERGDYGLTLELARYPEVSPLSALLASAGVQSTAPKRGTDPRAVTRTLNVGALGTLHFEGLRSSRVRTFDPTRLGDTHLARR